MPTINLTAAKEIMTLAHQMRTQQARNGPQLKYQRLLSSQRPSVVYKIDAVSRAAKERVTEQFFKQLARGVVYFAIANPLVNSRPMMGSVPFPAAKQANHRVAIAQRYNAYRSRMALEMRRMAHAAARVEQMKQDAASEASFDIGRAEAEKMAEEIKVLSWLSKTE